MFSVHCFTKILNKKAQGGTKEMKRKWIALVLSVSVLAGTEAVPAFASEMQQEISEMPAVETLQDHTLAETDSVEENCVLVGLKGSYLASADAALKRINEIRKRRANRAFRIRVIPTESLRCQIMYRSNGLLIWNISQESGQQKHLCIWIIKDQMERCVFHRHHQMEWRAGEKFWHGITAMI